MKVQRMVTMLFDAEKDESFEVFVLGTDVDSDKDYTIQSAVVKSEFTTDGETWLKSE